MRPLAIPIIISICAAMATPSFADPCDQVPAGVGRYMTAHPGWSITRPADLNIDDQRLWSESRPDKCPGLAVADLDGRGRPSYGLVLRRGDGAALRQKVVILRSTRSGLRAATLMASHRPDIPLVIWKAEPGRAVAWDGGRAVNVAHESLVLEQMEAWASQFYWNGARLRSILVSD